MGRGVSWHGERGMSTIKRRAEDDEDGDNEAEERAADWVSNADRRGVFRTWFADAEGEAD